MTLRPEFEPPILDEAFVARLAELAAEIDGARPGEWEEPLEEFNRLSGLELSFGDFQGIYGAEEHDIYVRRILLAKKTSSIAELSRAELSEVFAKICSEQCSEAERDFALAQLKHNLGDPQISDLIYWPGEYFGDGNNGRNMTPDEMADAALERKRRRDVR